jgi:acylaminoacyl-peptidase
MLTGLPALAQPSAAPATPAAERAFTYTDMLTANRLSDPRVSPDGRHVVYAVRATDMEANRGVSSLFIQDLNGEGQPRRLAISDGGANTARWGADGSLYFLSGRSGMSQVWKTDSTGATATPVTNLPLDVNAWRLSADASKIVVSLAVHPTCDDLACSVARGTEAAARQSTGQVYDRMFVRHWDTWADGTQNHLFVVNADGSGDPVWVTHGFDGNTPSKPFGDEGEFTFTPDGSAVVFSARVAGQSMKMTPGTPVRCSRPTAAPSPIAPWPVRASRPTAGRSP